MLRRELQFVPQLSKPFSTQYEVRREKIYEKKKIGACELHHYHNLLSTPGVHNLEKQKTLNSLHNNSCYTYTTICEIESLAVNSILLVLALESLVSAFKDFPFLLK